MTDPHSNSVPIQETILYIKYKVHFHFEIKPVLITDLKTALVRGNSISSVVMGNFVHKTRYRQSEKIFSEIIFDLKRSVSRVGRACFIPTETKALSDNYLIVWSFKIQKSNKNSAVLTLSDWKNQFGQSVKKVSCKHQLILCFLKLYVMSSQQFSGYFYDFYLNAIFDFVIFIHRIVLGPTLTLLFRYNGWRKR